MLLGPSRVGWRTMLALTAAALMVAVPALVVMPVAHADDSEYEEFYTPPDPLPPGRPGDLIRTEPSRLALEPSGQLGAYVGTGTRIMYRSTDAAGNPVAVTGTYIEPDVPWPGTGPRPLLAYATGPYGAGEQCAPSRLFNQGIHFSQGFDLMFNVEEGFIATLLARGYAIVVTDGVGMGVHGPQSPMPRSPMSPRRYRVSTATSWRCWAVTCCAASSRRTRRPRSPSATC